MQEREKKENQMPPQKWNKTQISKMNQDGNIPTNLPHFSRREPDEIWEERMQAASQRNK